MLQNTKKFLTSILLVFAVTTAMIVAFALPARAAEFNCGAYGAGEFGQGHVCASTTGDDDLSNTGQALAVAVPAGMIVAGVGILYRINRKKKNHKD